ncbi:MAG: hypothetical protein ABIM40_14075 [Pseudomonadota bacterium]
MRPEPRLAPHPQVSMSTRARPPYSFSRTLLAVGSSSVALQLILVREFLAIFGGNELVVGVTLGIWLLAQGAGTWLGGLAARQAKNLWGLIHAGHLVLAILGVAALFAVRVLPLAWVRGSQPGFVAFLFTSLAVLVPYGLASGVMLPLAGRIPTQGAAGRVYAWDTAGDILGGLVFGLVLVWALTHWQSAAAFGFLHLAAGAGAAKKAGYSRWRRAGGILCAALVGGSLFLAPLSRAMRFPGQEVVLWKNTRFSQLAVTRSGNQYNLWQDGVWLYSSGDPSVENLAHPALCQVPEGARVLLVGGGVLGLLTEIAKHQPSRVDYVELDPTVLALDDLLSGSLAASGARVHVGDGRAFIRLAAPESWDVILLDLPDPDNAQLNRFYTREFFHEARAALAPEGVFAFTLAGADNYLDPRGLALNRAVYQALATAFPQILVLPGETHHFLASDSPLSLDIAPVLARRRIITRQLEPIDLPTMTDPMRVEGLAAELSSGDEPANADLSPRAFGHMLDLWLARSQGSGFWMWATVAGVGFLSLVAWSGSAARMTLITTGCAGMGLELALILLFQVVYGYAYTALCLFVTLFLAGSAAGALGASRAGERAGAWVRRGEWGLALVLATALACLPLAESGPRGILFLAWGVIPLLILAAGALTGIQFAAAALLLASRSASSTIGGLYLADLAGAALGTVVLGLAALPRLGIAGVLAIALGLKIANLVFNPFGRKMRGG